MNNRLYKAERLNGGGVVKGYYCKIGETITGDVSPEGLKHFIIPVGTTSLNGAVEVKQETVVESTGVVDENGKEIWQYNECRLKQKDSCGYIAEGYIDFINGSFIFVQYVYHNIVLLCELNIRGYSIEIVSDWYNEKLSKTKFEEDDEGQFVELQTDCEHCKKDTSDTDDYIKFLEKERDDMLSSLDSTTDVVLRTTVGAYPCARNIKERTEYSIKNAFARCIEEFKNMKNL